jgi:hypothetical protein
MRAPAGICEGCRHVHVVTSARGSVFLRCLLHDIDPRFPKYPPLPVTQCSGFACQEAPKGEVDRAGK